MVEVLGNDIQIIDEPQRNSFQTAESDPGFLAAKGKFYGSKQERCEAKSLHIRKLSNAAQLSLQKHGYAKIRAVGDDATANAVRAIEIASRRCLKDKGVRLIWQVAKEIGNIGELRDERHVTNVEAFVFSLSTFQEENNSAST